MILEDVNVCRALTAGCFPNDGELVKNQGTGTVNVSIENANDSIVLDCKYHMESNKKSSAVKTDVYYHCDSIVYEFYLE